MKLIEVHPLGRGIYSKVDDDDYDWIIKHRWYLRPDGYVVTVQGSKEKGQKTLRLHRLINKTPPGMFTDHRNGIRLDNRKTNLRTVTQHQNNMNTSKKRSNTSGYLGVSRCHRSGKWRARIDYGGRNITIGAFECKHESAYVFNQVALQLRGEYARLNDL